MKIRYVDLLIVNKFIDKYTSCHASYISSINFLRYYIALNNYSLSLSAKFNVDKCNVANDTYTFFKFSVYFVLLNSLFLFRGNKLKSIYSYMHHCNFYFYLISLLKVYYKFLDANENVFFVTKSSVQFLENNRKLDNFKGAGFVNYLLRNKIRLVLDLDNSLSSVFLHRIREFDICVIKLNCNTDNSKWLFLNFVYYLRELNRYRHTLRYL